MHHHLFTLLRPQVSAFSPASIPNLAGWLDASDASTIVQSSGAVSQWNDKSGNGSNATQSTGTLQFTTASHTLNGRNVLYSPSKVMNISGTIPGIFSGDWTAFHVQRDTIANTGAADFWYLGTNNGYGLFEYGAGHTVTGVANTSYAGSAYPFAANTNAHILGAKRASTAINSFVDGALATTASNATSATISTAYLASYNGTGGGAGQHGFAECLYYSRALTNTEMNLVGNYLAAKWGLTWAAM